MSRKAKAPELEPLKLFRVYFAKIDPTWVDVRASDQSGAIAKASQQWRDYWGKPDVSEVTEDTPRADEFDVVWERTR